MKPYKKLQNGDVIFPKLRKPGINVNLCSIFMQLRTFRGIGEEPRLFFLSSAGSQYTDTATTETYRLFNHLEIWKCGRATFSSFYNLVLSSEATSKIAEQAYNSDMAILKNNGAKRLPSEKSWLEIQWELYETSGYGIIEENEPAQVSFDTDIYTFAYINKSKIIDGESPAWDAFMSQMEPDGVSESFKAFCWSALDPANFGRQICYLYDDKASGKTGKSTVANVLSTGLLQQVVGSFNEKTLKNQFGFAHIYGKRLLICGDNKNPHILHNQELHSITGGDLSSVEPKFEMARFSRVFARILICSNDAPQIDSFRGHERSRLILIRMNSQKCTEHSHYSESGEFIGDNTFEKRLSDQLPHFLYKCEQAYKKFCPSRREIIVPEECILDVSSDDEETFEQFASDFLDFGPDYFIESSRLHEMLVVQTSSTLQKNYRSQFFSNFKSFLENRGVCKIRRQINGLRSRFYIGVRKRGETASTLSPTTSTFNDIDVSEIDLSNFNIDLNRA